VFQACAFRPFVDNAGWLMPAARRVAGPVADWAIRHTFFKHFCAGECVETIQPVVAYLAAHGIRPILQYAAEDDMHEDVRLPPLLLFHLLGQICRLAEPKPFAC